MAKKVIKKVKAKRKVIKKVAKKSSRAIKDKNIYLDSKKDARRLDKDLMQPQDQVLYDIDGFDTTSDVDRVAPNERKALKVSYKAQKKAKKVARKKK